MIYVNLSCGNKEEADKIARNLLEQKLVVCVKQIPVESMYWWQGQIEKDQEIMLVMETEERLFKEIDEAVKKLHSYDQYVLSMIPITHTNDGVSDWLKETLKQS